MCQVSVLMPVYNAEKYLAEAIDSIIAQSFRDWELLIINDGSTDSSKSIIESYDETRIHYIENTVNIGLIKTLNKGINLCKGEYIARMDADDISNPERLALQVNFLDQNKDYILCGTNATVIDYKGLPVGKIVNPATNALLQISLLFTNPFVHPSIMIRKNALESDRFNSEALHVEDFELWTRLAKKGKLANLKAPLLSYRWHDTNVSVKYSEIQESAKNTIIRNQLELLNINPKEKQLKLHRLTFQLYTLGQKNNINTELYKEVGNWFNLLKQQNREIKVYPSADFEAFLWSRWFVLCISQNNLFKAATPPFISLTPSIIYKTLQLILYLKQK